MTEPSLTDFLLARISEEEAQARELVPGRVDPENARWHTESLAMASLDDRQRRYVANWAPPRVLAECEAKKRIVDLWEFANREASMGAEWPVKQLFDGRLSMIEAALRALAAVYADHPEFQPEWRP
jgi:hypothetical protein